MTCKTEHYKLFATLYTGDFPDSATVVQIMIVLCSRVFLVLSWVQLLAAWLQRRRWWDQGAWQSTGTGVGITDIVTRPAGSVMSMTLFSVCSNYWTTIRRCSMWTWTSITEMVSPCTYVRTQSLRMSDNSDLRCCNQYKVCLVDHVTCSPDLQLSDLLWLSVTIKVRCLCIPPRHDYL